MSKIQTEVGTLVTGYVVRVTRRGASEGNHRTAERVFFGRDKQPLF